jgi:hypothetical protein
MTHCQYDKPLETFDLDITPESVYEVNIMEEGRAALEQVNRELGALLFCVLHKPLIIFFVIHWP